MLRTSVVRARLDPPYHTPEEVITRENPLDTAPEESWHQFGRPEHHSIRECDIPKTCIWKDIEA